MSRSTTILISAVVGAALGFLIHLIYVNIGGGKGGGVTGGPPVTVSDGSLHAHSLYDWTTNVNGDQTIIPKAASGSGSFSNGCKMTVPNPLIPPLPLPNPFSPTKTVSALLWLDDGSSYDLSPLTDGVLVTITHDTAGAGSAANAAVTVSIPPSGAPTIHSVQGGFGPSMRGNRMHSRPGNVSEIKVVRNSGAVIKDWIPATQNPHYTIGLCYQ
jgi:hypothetical protein